VEIIVVKHRSRQFNEITYNINRIEYNTIVWGFVSIKTQQPLNSIDPFGRTGDSPMG
jgi:hypothetical protein